ncbi:ShlB/FhaC/HecB family hemolysin secretion/activation protein [Herbaspirillum robiniae]|uniref:ShlB/FhaC/HecB family hemolysin secretion/activation protein n=1 Tax=Herbaspirillum robiniae TaxID=2014887 RepID=A0ABX2LTY5_9BURK|nr:ShlB/FhaC/HecB family hemolysin secretion/activation protein [Herbaspirillum robiniae]NUU01566.1 ShlB/FhaC/HecB family hemolysin secretion/activation protein [Herbaspirillum robiniae]
MTVTRWPSVRNAATGRNLFLACWAALAWPAKMACAAPPPLPSYGISDAVRSANPPALPPDQNTRPEALPLEIDKAPEPIALPGGDTILVRDFQLEGAPFLAQGEWSPLLEPFRNKELGMADIEQAANLITQLCRKRGYLVARAYVPRQQSADGVLRIVVVPGAYGRFELRNETAVSDALIEGTFSHARDDGNILTRGSLERALLLAGDIPGLALPQVSLMPGQAPGTADLLITARPGPAVGGYVVGDNYGSRFTGKERLSAGLELNSPLDIGDRLSLQGLVSRGTGLMNGRLAYAFPLGAGGLRLELAATRTLYKLGQEYADLQATGTANIYEATLSYPIKRTRDDSWYVSLNAAHKQLKDDVAAVSSSVGKRVRTVTLAVREEAYTSLGNMPAMFNLGASVSTGRLSFDDAQQLAADQAGPDSSGQFSRFNAFGSATIALAPGWTGALNLQFQQSLGKNLTGVEQMSVSGPGAIKSYPDGVVGDNAIVAGLELRRALDGGAGMEHGVSVFANYGAVRPHNGDYAGLGEVRVGDAGIGYDLSYRPVFGRMQLARTLGSQRQTEAYNHAWKLQAQLGFRF